MVIKDPIKKKKERVKKRKSEIGGIFLIPLKEYEDQDYLFPLSDWFKMASTYLILAKTLSDFPPLLFMERKSIWFVERYLAFSLPKEFKGPDSDLIKDFHDKYMITIMTLISTFVFIVFWGMSLYEERNKKIKSRFLMEINWILLPLGILFLIGLPSMGILYELEDSNDINRLLSVKTTGFQWFWTYELENGETVESYITSQEEEDSLNNMTRDGYLRVPSNNLFTNFITSKDVIHRWAVPYLKVKMDAIPGRLNQLSLIIETPRAREIILGQCSELCGVNHRFMPIVIRSLKK